MNSSTDTIRADFDRIALVSEDGWNHNNHYHRFLLRHLPSPCTEALDVGCGTGSFSRLLAERAEQVLALDLSPQMIRLARERSQQFTNIEFVTADALTWELPAERFDCIVSIATLHHLPMAAMLSHWREALRVNGTLMVLDLFQPARLSEHFLSLAAVPASVVLRLVRTGRLRGTRAAREAWAQHGQHEVYPTLAQVHRDCAAILPGAELSRHLLWRYSIIWRKTPAAESHGFWGADR